MEEHRKDEACRELYVSRHAAIFCRTCDKWITKKCSLISCFLCLGRPERPSDMAQAMIDDPELYRVSEAQ